MDNQIEAIIFDLGGVLIELKENPFPDSWLSDSKSFLPSNWLSNDLASSFDRGEISAKEFGEDLKSSLGIDVALDEFLKEFAAWPVGPMPGVKSLLRDLRQNCTLVALSNNNEIHWPRVLNEFGVAEYFDHMFASHLLGMAKPDPRIFQYVLDELKLEPQSVLFFDDSPGSVKAAKKLGINSFLTSGVEQVEEVLQKLGLLSACQGA